MLTIVGLLLIASIMYVLIRGKTSPIIAFILFPIIAALILGFSLGEIGGFAKDGLSSMLNTATLFIFSITFFSIMHEVGIFNPMVDALTKRLKSNVFVIMLAVVVATMIGHLDGSGATTFLIVVPAFMPIFKKVGIRAEALLSTMIGTMAIMNLVPWGGPTLRASTVIEWEASQLFNSLIPALGVMFISSIFLAYVVSRIEVKNGAGPAYIEAQANVQTDEEVVEAGVEISRTKFWLNVALILIILGTLFLEILPLNFSFMIGASIALLLNFPDPKVQSQKIKEYAAQAMVMTMTLFAVGIFMGFMKNAGVIDAIATTLISYLPESLFKHAHWIVGLFGAPLMMGLSTDAFYYVLLPIVLGMVTPYGIAPNVVATTLLTTGTYGTMMSPGVAAVYVGLGLAEIDLGDHLKYSFKLLWPLSIITLILNTLVGIIKF